MSAGQVVASLILVGYMLGAVLAFVVLLRLLRLVPEQVWDRVFGLHR